MTSGEGNHEEEPEAESMGTAERPTEQPVEAQPRFGTPGKPFANSVFVTGLVGGAGLIVAYAAYRALVGMWSLLVLIFVAMFLAIGLNPAVVRLRAWGLNRGLAVIAVGLAMLLVVCGGIAALIPPIVQQGNQVIERFPGFVQRLAESPWLNDINEKYDVVTKLQDAVSGVNVSNVFGGVVGGVGTIFGGLFNLLMTVILTFYFLVAFDRLKAGAYRLVPASRRDRVQRIGDEILTKVGGYMIGALGIGVCAGITSFVFMLIVGIPYAYALALLVAILDLIPQIGATLGAVVVSIVGFATSVPIGIACVVFFILYQQLENWIIYPKVMNRAVSVTDLAAIVGVLLGVGLLGVVGALISVPAVAAIQLIIREVTLPRQNLR